jgi:hypothetical protein
MGSRRPFCDIRWAELAAPKRPVANRSIRSRRTALYRRKSRYLGFSRSVIAKRRARVWYRTGYPGWRALPRAK